MAAAIPLLAALTDTLLRLGRQLQLTATYGIKRRLRLAVRCNNLTAADWYKLLHDLTNAFGSVSLSALRKARLA